MQLPIVVGVDGSPSALTAVDWAVDEAGRRDLPLRLVYASLGEADGSGELAGAAHPGEVDGAAHPGEPRPEPPQEILSSASRRAQRRDPKVQVSAVALPDEARAALLREARNATLLVVGQRGRGTVAELLLGSVGLAMAARAPGPVVVVRGESAAREGLGARIVVGVGDAGSSAAAVRFAFEEAELRQCPLVAVRTWRRPAHASTGHPLLTVDSAHAHAERASALLTDALHENTAAHPKVDVRRLTLEGSARKVLLELALEADLLVLGARRRHGYFGLQLGHVGHTALHHAACPVVVVPQHG
ncbi:universal stress protein [Streptomyces sp. TRM66268-LWL]|uniref:Universal stress protein n=1 Tax=Streptomyces polyasparticus TaxID=2767826 RepID=A0ABR7SR77_9ACTN|nr:universal stress protein [Streptomyces polyasparticus]MBC9717389.1 universal stress protein [Streptomyces polyasparticus]